MVRVVPTTRFLVPTAFAATVMAVALAALNQFSFAVMSGMGLVCSAAEFSTESWSAGERKEVALDISNGCQDTPIFLSGEASYRIEVENEKFPVGDFEPADTPTGYWKQPPVTWLRRLATPFLRHLAAQWFTPIVRVAGSTPEEFVLSDGHGTVRPREGGRMFVFVNDAVIALPGFWTLFYQRDSGVWKLTVVDMATSGTQAAALADRELHPNELGLIDAR